MEHFKFTNHIIVISKSLLSKSVYIIYYNIYVSFVVILSNFKKVKRDYFGSGADVY